MRELACNTMTDTAAKLAEHYRKLTAEEVAMAKVALTNEARARHYAKAPIIGSWRMQRRKAIQLRVKPVASVSMSGRGKTCRPLKPIFIAFCC
jgi:hypothetical protein